MRRLYALTEPYMVLLYLVVGAALAVLTIVSIASHTNGPADVVGARTVEGVPCIVATHRGTITAISCSWSTP